MNRRDVTDSTQGRRRCEGTNDRRIRHGGVGVTFEAFPGGSMGFVAVLIFGLAVVVVLARRML